MKSVSIRPACPADVPALTLLWREMWDYHSRLDPRFAASPVADQAMAEWLRAGAVNPDGCLLVAEADGLPIGYVHALVLENSPAVLPRRYGLLSEIAVTAAARRAGVGTQLLEAAHRWLAAKGVEAVEVNVGALNPASRAFWRKHGYGGFVERYRREFQGERGKEKGENGGACGPDSR